MEGHLVSQEHECLQCKSRRDMGGEVGSEGLCRLADSQTRRLGVGGPLVSEGTFCLCFADPHANPEWLLLSSPRHRRGK